MSQTFDTSSPNEQGFNWDKGSHLMIADTNIDPGLGVGATRNAMGIGLVGTSFLLVADDMRVWLKPMVGPDYYSGGLDLFSARTRFALNTTFGGGVLPDNNGLYGTGLRFVQGAVIEGNLEGAVNMRLSPSDPLAVGAKNYLGYSWAIRLMDRADDAGASAFGTSPYGSFISLAEPSRPEVAIRFAEMSGDIALVDGRIDVRDGQEDGDDKPKMVISHTMLLGDAAAARMGAVTGMPALPSGQGPEFRIDNIMLGDASLGRVVMPSAKIYSAITLEPKFTN